MQTHVKHGCRSAEVSVPQPRPPPHVSYGAWTDGMDTESPSEERVGNGGGGGVGGGCSACVICPETSQGHKREASDASPRALQPRLDFSPRRFDIFGQVLLKDT